MMAIFYKETTDSHFQGAVSGKMNYEKGKTG
jgi:hypothetical protein